ncbi:Flp family type IVb pilin [bacterium LRH843]|nr:Flp family type IVb pilin [bacterium LRH843]
MLRAIKSVLNNEKGQALSEYGVILGIVLVAVIAVLITFGDAIVGVFNNIISSLPGS